MRKFNAIRNAVNFGKGKNRMNKFNENIQSEETTEYQESEAMNEMNNELQNKINELDKRELLNKHVLRLDESSEGKWRVTIHEYYPPLSDRTFAVSYMATFHNHTNGGMHQELFPLLKSAGEFLIAKVDQYYQQHSDANATDQLNTEDAIDTLG